MTWFRALAAAGLAAALLSASAVTLAGPNDAPRRCPHLVRDYARLADLPAGARVVLQPAMAERGGRFNVSDAIGPGEDRLPFARFVSARQTGCTLSVRYEYGGIAHGFATAIMEQNGARWVLVRQR